MSILSCPPGQSGYLKRFGYGTLALPKASIQPLTMLAKTGGRLRPIGPLAGTLLPGAIAIPEMTRTKTADISGSKTGALDASLGLDILGGAIGALSGSTLGFKAAYKNASSVEFEFGDVFENRIEFTDLDSFLASAKPHTAIGPAIQQMLEDDDIYVITATIDARQITVTSKASDGTDLGLEVPVVQQLVGGKIAVGATSTTASVLTYTSTDTPLAIGAEVVQLFFRNKRYQTAKLTKPGTQIGLTEDKVPAEDRAPDVLIEM